MIIVVYTDITHRELANCIQYELANSLDFESKMLQRDTFIRMVKAKKYPHTEDLHIFVDLHHLTSRDIGIKLDKHIKKYIGYNFVLIHKKLKHGKKEDVIRLYQNALQVWDYAHFNLESFKVIFNLKPKMVEFGYSQAYDKTSLYATQKKDIDILFLGALSARRMQICNQIRKQGFNIVAKDRVFGKEKDILTHRAKIVLNIYKQDVYAKSFSSSRFCFFLSNGCLIITEKSQDEILSDKYRDLLIQGELDELAELCNYYLTHESERIEFAKNAYENYKNNFQYCQQFPDLSEV